MARFIITGEYKDKATRAAQKDLKKLNGLTMDFGKISKKYWAIATTAASYYAQKALKESIKNAMDDEKSQRVLALTLANVANATDAAVIATEQQISAMQAAYGVVDDQLRPALARLARSSGSASQAVYDLKLALDISAATGKSLEAVTGALGKALDGNYASLQRLGLGLDQSLIKSKDQKKIFDQLRKTFAGFASAEAATVEGKFRRIAVAADEAKEIIGVALIDSINNLVASQGGVDNLSKSFNDLAYAIADTIRGIGVLTDKITTLSTKFKIDLVGAIPVLGGWIRGLQSVGKQQRINLSLQKSTTQQVISARNAEVTALNAKKQATDQVTDGTKKTIEQLIAEEAARKAGFKITEDIDSIQTVAAAKRLEESRQYKASVLDAAQAQFDAIKRNYDLQNAVFGAQLTAFEVMYAAMKAKASQGIVIPVTMSAAVSTGEGLPKIITGLDTAPARGASGMTLAKEAAIAARLAREAAGTFNPSDALDYSMNAPLNNNSAVARVQQVFNVNVNAGAVGNETYLAQVINDSLAQAARLGLTTTPAGYIGSP